MAKKYTKQQIRQMLHRSTFNVVMNDGIENLTIRKVANGCGLSDPYIYQCYEDMADLLQAAYMEIDEQTSTLISELITNHIDELFSHETSGKICWIIWSKYWDFLMEDPERTVFFWRYYNSAYFSNSLTTQHHENYKVFADYINDAARIMNLTDKISVDVLLTNIIDNTVSFAFKLHIGRIPSGVLTKRTIFLSIFSFLFHIMKVTHHQLSFLNEIEDCIVKAK